MLCRINSLCSYKNERYYWEIIITARKVCVVALSVFGKELGVQRQSQVALLLLLVCIVLEILGKPFHEMHAKHAVLKRLELSSLLVEWGTLWCGLMIYQSGPESEGMKVFMTVCVILVNVVLMLWFLIVLFRAYAEERKESTSSRKVERRLTQTWHERDGEEDAVQADTWQNTVGANDGMVEHWENFRRGPKHY